MLSFLQKLFVRNRRLGVADSGGRYDLPLHKSSGSAFLVLLVALMTFLAMMSVSAAMVLDDIAQSWSSGLENKVTVEIPALKPNGKMRNVDDITEISKRASIVLQRNTNVKNIDILSQEKITELVSPWLGDDVVLNDIPLPGLISLHLRDGGEKSLDTLNRELHNVAEDIHIDTHESWLGDILRLAGSLKFSSFFVTFIIGLTTFIAVAGAIRSRMAEHKSDIELLHLMGASDRYITKQLQRHAIVLTLKGAVAGGMLLLLSMGIISIISGGNESGLLPDHSFSASQWISLLSMPFIISIIASQTARFTVLRVLGQMP